MKVHGLLLEKALEDPLEAEIRRHGAIIAEQSGTLASLRSRVQALEDGGRGPADM
jgi:hypothetical protein